MKCPLFCIGDKRVQLGEETEYGDCLQGECAWWDEAEAKCAVLSLAQWCPFLINQVSNLAPARPVKMTL